MIEQLIQELESIHGDHTNLVTFTVSSGNSYSLAIKRINQELSTATNIKSRV